MESIFLDLAVVNFVELSISLGEIMFFNSLFGKSQFNLTKGSPNCSNIKNLRSSLSAIPHQFLKHNLQARLTVRLMYLLENPTVIGAEKL